MRLIIAGGGTGGHLFPGIAVAEEFLARGAENQVLFVGTDHGIEARLLPKLGYPLALISASGMKGLGATKKLLSAARLLYGYAQSRKILKEFRPDLVLGVGGYASAPLVLAARGMGIRRFIHEQNAAPGLTNKILGRFVDGIFIPYPYAADDHQRKNAESLLKRGAGFMILEEDLTGEHLAAEILARMEHPEKLAEVERNARSLAQLDAAQAIVASMLEKSH